MIEVLFRMSCSEMGQKIEFNLHIPGQIIFTNPTDKCPERQQWNMCPVYPYPTWISCWPKKKTELFLAKVKPIASLERHKLTGSVIKTRPNRWVSHPWSLEELIDKTAKAKRFLFKWYFGFASGVAVILFFIYKALEHSLIALPSLLSYF